MTKTSHSYFYRLSAVHCTVCALQLKLSLVPMLVNSQGVHLSAHSSLLATELSRVGCLTTVPVGHSEMQ